MHQRTCNTHLSSGIWPDFGRNNNAVVTFNTSPDRFVEHPKWVTVLSTVPESHFSLFTKISIRTAMLMIVIGALSLSLNAQTDEFGDTAADPVKLFERGQSAHARGEFEKALEFYEQALKVRPEFPEAEFQRGNALVSLSRFDEADAAFRRAITLKKNWSLPYSALGVLLMRRDKDEDAATVFQQALTIDPQDNVALRMLSEIRLRGGNPKEGLEFATRATHGQDAPASAWIGLAVAERANNNKAAARKILDKVLTDEPGNWAALLERADLLTDDKAFDLAIADLQ